MSRVFKICCYRYWLESRSRFLIALVMLLVVLLLAFNQAEDTIIIHPRLFGGRQLLFTQYVWVIVYKGYFLTIFTLSSFILGVGSTRQERTSGIAQFTLALPVKRKTLVYSKLATSASLVLILSLVIGLLIPFLSFLFGFYYPLQDALLFSVLISVGGFVFMMMGFVLSVFIAGETIVIPLGVAIMSTLFFITKLPALKSFNIFNFMVGAGYLSNDNFLFNKPIDLMGILLLVICFIIASMGLSKTVGYMNF